MNERIACGVDGAFGLITFIMIERVRTEQPGYGNEEQY